VTDVSQKPIPCCFFPKQVRRGVFLFMVIGTRVNEMVKRGEKRAGGKWNEKTRGSSSGRAD